MAAHAKLSVLTFFALFGGEVGQVALVRNLSLPRKRRAAVPVKGGPAGPSEASREAAPLTGTAARSYAVSPGPVGRSGPPRGVRRA
jgi:hypothetical protein